MKRWINFGFNLLGWTSVILVVAFFIAMTGTGDCGLEVRDCGETPRRLTFLVLAFGAIGLAYYVTLFISLSRRR